MGVYLLSGAGLSATGNWVDVHSIDNKRISLRIAAFGGFGGSAVIIETSPDAVHPFAEGTLTDGNQLIVEAPIDYIRARTDGALTGNATVIAEISG